MKKIMAIVAALVMVCGVSNAQMEAVDPVVVAPVQAAMYPLLWMDSFQIVSAHSGSNVVVRISYAPYRYITNDLGVVSRDYAPGDSKSTAKMVFKKYTAEQIAASPVLSQWTAGIVSIADALATQEGIVKP